MGPLGRPSTTAGFTLVEILVVMVVLAVGLLGTEALLLTGLRASRGAIEQTEAANLAADLGDRIRSNRAAGAAYALAEGALLPAPAKACRSAGECSPAEVAERDLYDWQQATLATLPGAATEVRVTSAGGAAPSVYSILIRWTASASAAGARISVLFQA